MRPLIGITSSELRAGHLQTLTRAGREPHDATFLGTTYFRAVERAGGLPVMLAPGDPALAAGLVARLDGVLLSGGPDIDPSFYGAQPDPRLGPTWPEADAFELAVARAAMQAGLPILGVCRGSQLINVACGGTLVQHLDGFRQSEPADLATETVAIVPRTRLHAVLRARRVAVNTFHHQAVERLGDGLRVSARAGGVVKAIEAPGHAFLLGVQWHAEALPDGALFEALVAASGSLGLRVAA